MNMGDATRLSRVLDFLFDKMLPVALVILVALALFTAGVDAGAGLREKEAIEKGYASYDANKLFHWTEKK